MARQLIAYLVIKTLIILAGQWSPGQRRVAVRMIYSTPSSSDILPSALLTERNAMCTV